MIIDDINTEQWHAHPTTNLWVSYSIIIIVIIIAIITITIIIIRVIIIFTVITFIIILLLRGKYTAMKYLDRQLLCVCYLHYPRGEVKKEGGRGRRKEGDTGTKGWGILRRKKGEVGGDRFKGEVNLRQIWEWEGWQSGRGKSTEREREGKMGRIDER